MQITDCKLPSKCSHSDVSLIREKREISEPDGYGGTNYWSWNVLVCRDCGKESSTTLDDDGRPSLDRIFAQAYYEVTGRTLLTEDDKNQISLLRENPVLFWAYPFPNSKYILKMVPEQLQGREKLEEINANINRLLNEITVLNYKANEIRKSCGLNVKYPSLTWV